MKSNYKLFYTIIPFVIIIFCFGCVKFPERHIGISGSNTEGIVPSDCFDKNGFAIFQKPSLQSQSQNLDTQGFSLFNWNTYKGSNVSWSNDLQRLSRNSDILVLQEGYLTDGLKSFLESHSYAWNIANAFTYNDRPVGTLTASRIQPVSACSFHSMEPISGIPKSVLITRYSLSETDKTLLLANLHMINFTLDNTLYRLQLEKVASALHQHDGPFIVAGDFNTWNESRKKILEDILDRLLAVPVEFQEDKRTTFMGNIVDHIYYRGLVLVDSWTEKVSSSDHNPMFVTFRLMVES